MLGPRHRFYFAGDTGYCDGFKQIGEYLGPFDLAAIPIGAYKPRWMMRAQHVDPEESVKIHRDIRAQRSVGIHWGTFALANEVNQFGTSTKVERRMRESWSNCR